MVRRFAWSFKGESSARPSAGLPALPWGRMRGLRNRVRQGAARWPSCWSQRSWKAARERQTWTASQGGSGMIASADPAGDDAVTTVLQTLPNGA